MDNNIEERFELTDKYTGESHIIKRETTEQQIWNRLRALEQNPKDHYDLNKVKIKVYNSPLDNRFRYEKI